MSDFLIQVLASFIGYGIFAYTHALLVTIFKAEKYENNLENIVFRSVKKALKGEG